MFKAGDRVRFKRDVDRYPYFAVKAGMMGTVVPYPRDTRKSGPYVLIAVFADVDLGRGGREWHNCVLWEEDFTMNEIADDLEVVR